MKSGVNMVLQEQLEFNSAIAYLIPTNWWEKFNQANRSCKSKQQLVFPDLNLQNYVDSFLLEFQDSIVAELEHKSNYLKFSQVFISPQVNHNVEWTLISSQLWALINSNLKCKFAVMALYDEKNPYGMLNSTQIQLQVIFCSRAKSDVFVGFLPETVDAIFAVRSIGYELGYVEMDNSRIIFPDKYPDRPYSYHQLENKKLCESEDTFLLAYNLEFVENKETKNGKLNITFGKGEEDQANSNEAMAGDILGNGSLDVQRNTGTMSTGAQTPSLIRSEDNNCRQFRVRELFREKQPQEIEELRDKAKKIVKGKLIEAKQQNEQEMNNSLELIMMEVLEHINLKKKNHKEKDIQTYE